MQERLLRSARAAINLDATIQFNIILADPTFQEWILNLNRSQLFKGEDSLGVELKKIGGGYSFTTEFLNQGKSFTFLGESNRKIAGQSPFLLETGDYYRSFHLILGNGFFKIDSDPQKDDNNLEDSFGTNLEGIQDENLQKIIQVIRNQFIDQARTLLAA